MPTCDYYNHNHLEQCVEPSSFQTLLNHVSRVGSKCQLVETMTKAAHRIDIVARGVPPKLIS